VPPPGAPIPINIDPSPIIDSAPTDSEIRDVVRTLKLGRAGGTSKIRAEDIRGWLRGAVEEEDPELTAAEGAGDNWRLFVTLIQTIWTEGEVPRQLHWVIVVLIPKGGGGYRGIGLLEPIWKVVETIMDKRLNVIALHECLHGFRAGKGTGTATIDAKLAQQLAFREQAPLYGVFIDLRKAFDSMDRGRCIEVLRGYGVGPRMLALIAHFWEKAELACRAEGNFGRIFKADRGVTQGGPLSPKIFNILVDAVVREWLRQLFGDKVARDGFDALGPDEEQRLIRLFVALFYADDGYIASRDPELLDRALLIIVGLFERVGQTNTTKTEAMICTPGKIRTRLSASSYYRRYAGFGDTRGWAQRQV